jgi:hypothetical protein
MKLSSCDLLGNAFRGNRAVAEPTVNSRKEPRNRQTDQRFKTMNNPFKDESSLGFKSLLSNEEIADFDISTCTKNEGEHEMLFDYS